MRSASLLAVLGATVLAACAAGPASNDFDFEDHAFIPSVRVSGNISSDRSSPSEPQDGHAIEFGLTGMRGSDSVSSDKPLTYGGETFAPQELRGEFDARSVELAYRYRAFFGRSQAFGIELLGGAGYTELGLTISGAAQRASRNFSNSGLVGAFGVIWRFRPATSLQGRYSIFDSGGIEGYRFDLYVAQALTRNALVRVGFTDWQLGVEGDQIPPSAPPSIGVRSSGPSLGFDFAY